jgi:hypothetical protein
MKLPSASNTTGTLLGTLAGGFVASSAPSWGFVVIAAASLGVTPVALGGLLAVGVTALVNYGVTHIAEISNLNELAKNYWPQIVPSYNIAKGGQSPYVSPISKGQQNSNINQ